MSPRHWPVSIVKVLLDCVVLLVAFWGAFVLRFEAAIPADVRDLFFGLAPWVVGLKLVCLLLAGILRLPWRHASLREARVIAGALMVATAILLVWRLIRVNDPRSAGPDPTVLPIGVLLIDLVLATVGIVGLRLTLRIWHEIDPLKRLPRNIRVRTLLIGAGDCGARTMREIVARPDSAITPVGFLDDEPQKHGLVIHGVPVLGHLDNLAEIATRYQVGQILITMQHVGGNVVRRITKLAEACGLVVKIIPQIEDVISGKVELSRIRAVAIEDLLRRDAVRLDNDAVASCIQGRVVVVTGAGGSIGSQLCHEIARFGPRVLLLVEKSENGLFHIHRQLIEAFPDLEIEPYLADICDETRMHLLFHDYHPDVVFHAAAHKHVPMMERHPGEAIKNNIGGTRALADLAHACGVGEFVMISTDKAVNPTSVMGVSKRVAELYIQSLAQRSKTRFVTVRFGNVLGSNGSVVPIFKEQIERGGPVTVTNEKMTRYFMTIPEACQLVLQAATMGRGGEIFILDMGDPVKIIDLARDLIRLSGLEPDRDIEICITGIRPGEKLYEELSLEKEEARKTRHPRIFVGTHQPEDSGDFDRLLEDLLMLANTTNTPEIHNKLKEIVPEYHLPASASEKRLAVEAEAGESPRSVAQSC